MADLKVRLEERIAEVQSSFDVLSKEFNSLREQRAKIDQRMAEIREEQIRLQGDYRSLSGLKDSSQKIEPLGKIEESKKKENQ